MAPQASKSRKREITEHLRTSPTPEARMLLELVGIMVEETRASLVTAEGDFQRLQGEARAWARLHKDLTTNTLTKENYR